MSTHFLDLFHPIFPVVSFGGIYIKLLTDYEGDTTQNTYKKVLSGVQTIDPLPDEYTLPGSAGHYMDLENYIFDVYFTEQMDSLYTKSEDSSTASFSQLRYKGFDILPVIPKAIDGFNILTIAQPDPDPPIEYGHCLKASVTQGDLFTLTVTVDRFVWDETVLDGTNRTLEPLPNVVFTTVHNTDLDVIVETHITDKNNLITYGTPSPDGTKIAYTVLRSIRATDKLNKAEWFRYSYVFVLDLETMTITIESEAPWFVGESFQNSADVTETQDQTTEVIPDSDPVAYRVLTSTNTIITTEDTLVDEETTYPIAGGFDASSNFIAATITAAFHMDNNHKTALGTITYTYSPDTTNYSSNLTFYGQASANFTLNIGAFSYPLGGTAASNTYTSTCNNGTNHAESYDLENNSVQQIRLISLINKEFFVRELTGIRDWVTISDFVDPDSASDWNYHSQSTSKLVHVVDSVDTLLYQEEAHFDDIGTSVGTSDTIQCVPVEGSLLISVPIVTNTTIGTHIARIICEYEQVLETITWTNIVSVETANCYPFQHLAAVDGVRRPISSCGFTRPNNYFSAFGDYPISCLKNITNDKSVIYSNLRNFYDYGLKDNYGTTVLSFNLVNIDNTRTDWGVQNAIYINGVIVAEVDYLSSWDWPTKQLSIRQQ